MPTPYEPGPDHQFMTAGTHVLYQRQNCAVLIGVIASEWALLEDLFVYFFSILTSEISGQTFKANQLAKTVFSSLDSYNARQGIVRSECKSRLSKELYAEYAKVEKQIKDCRNSRNAAVHSLWGITSAFPQDLIRSNNDIYIRYTPDDFHATVTEIVNAASALNQFQFKLQDQMMADAQKK